MGLDLETLGRGGLRERRASLELVEHFAGLSLAAVGDLVVAPARLDLVLDLVERAIARRRDAGDVEPDIAAFDLQRVVLDTRLGREGGGQQALRVGQVGDRLAGWVAAGAVDLDGA